MWTGVSFLKAVLSQREDVMSVRGAEVMRAL